MKKFIDWLFGKKKDKTAKEKLAGHPDHVSCDYGITNFNKTKRDKSFLDEIKAKRGHGKPQPPPPTQPPPTSTSPPAIIYLDFDGGVCSGTGWNTTGDIVYEDAGLALDEQQQILNLIAAYFSGFNVTVTADKSIFDAATSRKQQVNFTQSWEWYGQAGGVAFIGSMFYSSASPCWVFTSLLGYSATHIGEAATHEPGHTIGLKHQSTYDANCVKVAEYNRGDGINSPIMGYPYNLPAKWWVGPNSVSCTTIQDDAAVMTTALK